MMLYRNLRINAKGPRLKYQNEVWFYDTLCKTIKYIKVNYIKIKFTFNALS
jgi:hypothetical protein